MSTPFQHTYQSAIAAARANIEMMRDAHKEDEQRAIASGNEQREIFLYAQALALEDALEDALGAIDAELARVPAEQEEHRDLPFDAAKEAVSFYHRWHGYPGESNLDRFERIAEWFRQDTGMLRPGKDQSGPGPSYDERHTKFYFWCRDRDAEVKAKMAFVLSAIDQRGARP